jgi:hypothetical protein
VASLTASFAIVIMFIVQASCEKKMNPPHLGPLINNILSHVYIGKGYVIMPATATVIEIYFRSKMSMGTVNTYLPWSPWAA